MPYVLANNLRLAYETRGPADGHPLLLIMGTAGQLTLWPDGLVDRLAAKGFRVIRYDARDVGLSEKLPGSSYRLDDMAADAAALLDALDAQPAHVVGASMGGMVAQLLAAHYPDHVRSLTSISSTTANPDLPGPAPDLMARMTQPAPDPTEDLAAYVKEMLFRVRLTESPIYPTDATDFRAQTIANYHRAHYPAGFTRHVEAIFAAPDRRPKLNTLTVPTLVIHGAEDPLILPQAGEDTAANIPGAELLLVPDMGHDLPPQLFDLLADSIRDVATGVINHR